MKKIIDVRLFTVVNEVQLAALVERTKRYVGDIILKPGWNEDDEGILNVYLRREETDNELAERKKLETASEDRKRQIELAEYNRLKAKFEGVV